MWDLQGWYLEVRPDDLDPILDLHRGICYRLYGKFGMDPCIERHLKPDSEEGVLKNPIRLAAGWLQSMEKYLMAGETVLVNSNGGLMPLDGTTVLATIEKDAMEWPDHWDDEVITISRWPRGHHYYLSSNKGRVFVPPKYARYDDAVQAAFVYTKNVRSNEMPAGCLLWADENRGDVNCHPHPQMIVVSPSTLRIEEKLNGQREERET
jgi:hypothetical protein